MKISSKAAIPFGLESQTVSLRPFVRFLQKCLEWCGKCVLFALAPGISDGETVLMSGGF